MDSKSLFHELDCVWSTIFTECPDLAPGYNDKLLNSSIANEFIKSGSKNEIYSLKRTLKLIFENCDPDYLGEAVEMFIRIRQELISTFSEVSKEYEFDKMLTDALKLVVIDSFNRKNKDKNQITALPDLGKTESYKVYEEKTKELCDLLQSIMETNDQMAWLNDEIAEMDMLNETINEYLTKIRTHKFNVNE